MNHDLLVWLPPDKAEPVTKVAGRAMLALTGDRLASIRSERAGL